MTARGFRGSLIRLTLFTVVTVLLTGFLARTIQGFQDDDVTTYHAVFTNATRLKSGDDVRLAGVTVGRVQSVGQFLGWSAMPLAPLLGGGLLTLLGGPTAMAVLAGLAAAVALIPTLSRPVRSVPRPSDWSAIDAVAPEPAMAAA